MNIKDLKKKLNQEIDAITPDVFSRAKATPINRLLTAATPSQALQQRITIRVLAIMCILFVAMSVSLLAYFFMSDKDPYAPASASYVQVSVVSYDYDGRISDTTVLGYVIDKDGKVSKAFDEKTMSTLDDTGKTVAALCAEYAILPNDTVTVVVLNDSDRAANDCASSFVGAIRYDASNLSNVSVSSRVNMTADAQSLAALLSSRLANAVTAEDNSFSTLIALYSSLEG